ncbi:MAG: hypothetical protein AAGA77_01140 [Bacteroidota bacterium]
MKPVFIEETITRLKKIIDSTTSGYTDRVEVDEITDEIEKSLKAYKDNQENRILYYGTSVIVVLLSLILTYSSGASWPLMFLVIWLGGFMYYRVHERGLILNNIDKINKVKPEDALSKIVYLKSAIDLKVGRKSVLKVFLSVLISASVMMAHYLFVDTSFWLNSGLLVGAIIASYFFWNNFYKEDVTTLESMKSQLHQLESQIILGTGAVIDEEE